MTRSLLELERPYLSREQLQATIWRLTGTRNTHVVDELLFYADVYAVSQGPRLAEQIRERDIVRGRYDRIASNLAQLKPTTPAKTASPRHIPLPDARQIIFTEDSVENLLPHNDHHDVWYGPNGDMIQRCSKCGIPKSYDEFHADKLRWNGKALQCKLCKKTAERERKDRKRSEISARAAVTAASAA